MEEKLKNEMQTVFDRVATHLLTQNAQSLDIVDGECLYRGEDGKMCAAGCLLTDGQAIEFEGFDWSEVRRSKDIESMFSKQTHGMIEELQYIHDKSKPILWPTFLEDLAIQHNLDSKVVRDFKKS